MFWAPRRAHGELDLWHSGAFNTRIGRLQIEFVGAGFMIGSAFAVVLPEGFETLFSAAKFASHEHDHHRSLLAVHENGHEHDAVGQAHYVDANGGEHSRSQAELQLPVPRWSPGAVLLAGFLAMMLFEFLHHHMEGDSHAHTHAYGHSQADIHAHAHGADALEAGSWTPNSVPSEHSSGGSVFSTGVKLRLGTSGGQQASSRLEVPL